MHGQVRELCTNYGPIDLLWFDGHWERRADEWRSAELATIIRSLQPQIVINDRLADSALADYLVAEQSVPVTPPERRWETSLTMNETWAYNPRDRAYKSSAELVITLAEVVAKGGNLLVNVGPTPDGELPPEATSRLRVLGDWLDRNGEAIYGAGPGLPAGAFYGPSTRAANRLYLHVTGYPSDGILRVRGLTRPVEAATVLATGQPLEFEQHPGSLEQGLLRIALPQTAMSSPVTTVRLMLK